MDIMGVTEAVVNHLKNSIITNKLAPGEKLNESDLASQLNISRAPIREAFRILESEHLIVWMPRRGVFVSEVSVEKLRELYSARKMIECHAIDILQAKGIRYLPSLKASLDRAADLAKPAEGDDQDEIVVYLKGLTEFHEKLVSATDNTWIIRFYNSIVISLARYQYYCMLVPDLTSNSYEMHEQIFSLLSRGAHAKAKQTLLAHIDYTVDFIEEYMKKPKKAMNL